MAQSRPQMLVNGSLAHSLNRRELLRRSAIAGAAGPLAAGMVRAPFKALADDSTLNVTYYDWILSLHPQISDIDAEFGETFPIQADVAPSAGFSTDIFVTEARDETSSWDLYIGVTPFLEMIQLAESGVIEPWDPFLPEGVLSDILPAMREEGTYNGEFYVWPFLLDVTVLGWNAELVERAGLDPEEAPGDWDSLLASAQQVADSGAAPFGLTFDFHAWRSLLPITHSIDTDVYEENGMFRWTSDAAIEALEIMKRMTELANPDVLREGTTDGGVNQTPDEQAFAAQQAAYYIKYQNAHLRFASVWPDPSNLRLAALPVQPGGAGGTVFWDTGAVLLRYGDNKEQAVDYMLNLTRDERIWQQSVQGNPPQEPAVGQLPVYQSLWDDYTANQPEWMPDWAFSIYEGLDAAQAIAPSRLSIAQFNIAAPHYVAYLEGSESDARTAMENAEAAVMAEFENL